jgi:hypothetical protein
MQEKSMTRKRNRFKQTTSLEQRLAKFSIDLRQRAWGLLPDTQEAQRIKRKIEQTEVVRRLSQSLANSAPKL